METASNVVRALGNHEELTLDELGPRIRVDYTPDGDGGGSGEWLRGLVNDLADDGLVEVTEVDDRTAVRPRR